MVSSWRLPKGCGCEGDVTVKAESQSFGLSGSHCRVGDSKGTGDSRTARTTGRIARTAAGLRATLGRPKMSDRFWARFPFPSCGDEKCVEIVHLEAAGLR